MRRFAAVLVILTLLLPSTLFGADQAALVGYSPRSSQTEREWETKFRAIPDPANLREDMRRLMDWGVDGIVTDDPAVLRDLMAERGMALPPKAPQ